MTSPKSSNSESPERRLLRLAACPACDGSGSIPHQIYDDQWEAEQCQWCSERDALLAQPEGQNNAAPQVSILDGQLPAAPAPESDKGQG